MKKGYFPNTSLSLVQRFRAPMPKFFKVVFYIGLLLAAVSAGLYQFQQDLAASGMAIPNWITTVSGWVGAVSALVSKLTILIDE